MSWRRPVELNGRPVIEYVLEASFGGIIGGGAATSTATVAGAGAGAAAAGVGGKKKGKSTGGSGSGFGGGGGGSGSQGGGSGSGADRGGGSAVTEWRMVYRGAEPFASVTGLPGRSVKLRVCAANVMGRGPFSDARSFTTRPLPPSPPEAPTFSHLQPESVKVRWMPPETLNGSTVAGYRVQMREAAESGAGGGGSWVTAFTGATATALSFKATRLKPATTYEFEVVADTSEHDVGSSDFGVAAR